MRYLVTTAVLSGVFCALAQTQAADPAVLTLAPTPQLQPPPSGARPPFQRQHMPRTGPVRAGAALPGNSKGQDVPPDTPVITLAGVCSNPKTQASCQKVITREDLDRFINAFSPNAAGQARGTMAVQYARTLAYSGLAQAQGLDKDPVFAKELTAELELVRSRALATAFLKNLQTKMLAVSDTEIEKYYEIHRDEYEQVQVRRLSVPLEVPTELRRPLTRSAIKPYMEELRKRAVAGEDFNVLQQDAYKYFHIEATPPPVNITTLDRRTTQGDEAKALNLKPGEISDVLDSLAAVVIIQMESKETAPLAVMRQEIVTTLRSMRMQNLLNKLTKGVNSDFNLQYFGMASQPDIFGSAVIGTNQARASSQLRQGAPQK